MKETETVFICSPRSGDFSVDVRVFGYLEHTLLEAGYHVANPCEVNWDWGDGVDAQNHFLQTLLGCDAIAIAPGWDKQPQSSLEAITASHLDMRIIVLELEENSE